MDKGSTDDLKLALADARRAYRTVWAYQRRILDIMNILKDAFPKMKFYSWSSNQFAHTPNRGGSQFLYASTWAWDALPLYDVSFMFVDSELSDSSTAGPDRWFIDCRFQNDTYFPKQESETEPDAALFKDANDEKSMLILSMLQGTAKCEKNKWWDVWEQLEFHQYDNNTLPKLKNLESVRMSFNLEDISDSQSVINIANEFAVACKKKLGVVLLDAQNNT